MARHRRRGLTLLEILIAIALVIALGGLSLPMLARTLDARAFEALRDEANAFLLDARAAARERGAAIEVRWSAEPTRLAARPLGADDLAAESLDRSDRAGAARPEFGEPPTDAPEAEEEQDAPLVARPLPTGARFALDPPEDPDDPAARLDATRDPRDAEPVSIVLAVFLPDGSALVGGAVFLLDAAGRAERLEIDAFTGIPRWEPVVVGVDPAEEAEEPEEEPEPVEEESLRENAALDPPAPPAREAPRRGAPDRSAPGDEERDEERDDAPPR